MNTKWQVLCPANKIIAFNFPRYNSACPNPKHYVLKVIQWA